MSGFGILLLAGGVLVLFLLFRRRGSAAGATRPAAPAPVSSPAPRARDTGINPVGANAPETQEPAAEGEAQVPLPAALADFKLLVAADLDEDTRGAVQQLCERLPEPHPVCSRLAGGLDEPEELMEVVTSDPGLTASVLRTVNSAAFSLTSPISSVQHAITYLGVSFVKGLVAQAAVDDNLPEGTPEQLDALRRIWTSASCASTLAQMLGQELSLERPSVLATKALFFNLGDVALVMGHEDAHSWYLQGGTIVERIGAQQQACASNSAIVGAALARHWQLPEEIARAIGQGLLPLVHAPADLPLEGTDRRDAVLLYLASRLADRVTYRGLRDVGELDLNSREEPGLFHLMDHLQAADLGRVPPLLLDATFRRKANRLLSTLSS